MILVLLFWVLFLAVEKSASTAGANPGRLEGLMLIKKN